MVRLTTATARAVYLSIDRPEDVKASFETLGLGADDVDLIVVV